MNQVVIAFIQRVMEKILELADSYNEKYPHHFQVFLDNCIKTFKIFGANDYLFAAVYFIILETGFTPVDMVGNFRPDSIDFDIKKLRSVTRYTDKQIKITENSNKTKSIIYQIPLKLGMYDSSLCELQGVPSAEVNTHLIINFLSKQPQAVKSLCLSTEAYVEKSKTSSKHKYLLRNLKSLSLLIKNDVSVVIKDLIMTNEEEGCSPNLLCLPEEVQKKIVYFLKSDPSSVQCLSSTCSYFYSFIVKDVKLWEEICFQEYSGWALNKALQNVSTSGNVNVFRSAFLNLKMSELKRYNSL